MSNLFVSIIGIILTILIVVGVHEFGHFWVARLLGVKVLRFSIGFGKRLYSWRGRKDTEYVIAALPLGGYVQMLDEQEGNVAKKDLPFAYNRQPIYKRFLIVLAGPLFNLLFAFLLYWLLFVVGYTTMKPIVAKVTAHSIAEKAGIKPKDEVISLNNKLTHDWNKVIFTLIFASGGSQEPLPISVKNPTEPNIRNLYLDLNNWRLNSLRPDPLDSLGVTAFEPVIPAIVGNIVPQSNAINILNKGDKVIAINGKPVKDWVDVVSNILKYPDQVVQFKINRAGKDIDIPIKIGAKKHFFSKSEGFLGISPQFEWPKDLLRKIQYPPATAAYQALLQTKDFVYLNFLLLGKMLTGKISFQSLGGPITIFQSAGSALNYGIVPFLAFIAFLSIAIGVINVLPIPGLDGGHLLFQAIEVITQKPVPINVQFLFYRFGIILLIFILAQAMSNDILRLM